MKAISSPYSSPYSSRCRPLRQLHVSKARTWQKELSPPISTTNPASIPSRFLAFIPFHISHENEDENSSANSQTLHHSSQLQIVSSNFTYPSFPVLASPWRTKTMTRPRKSESSDQVQEAPPRPYHVLHKLPPGDSPYVRAKHVQLVEKDPEAAIVLFWKAINAGDRVDSALKDMAVVMKQQDRAEEAIEAIKSFRDRCSKQAQESLDNVLIDLYKKCGRVEEQIELLKQKLRMICEGEAFNGKLTKTARSHGRKFQVTIKQETSRVLGNLGWAYMQQGNHMAAEVVYRKAQIIDPDANKACNLCLCLIKQTRYQEAQSVLDDVLQGKLFGSDEPKSRIRAEELLQELEQCQPVVFSSKSLGLNIEDAFLEGLDHLMKNWTPLRSRRLPIFEEISSFRDQLAC